MLFHLKKTFQGFQDIDVVVQHPFAIPNVQNLRSQKAINQIVESAQTSWPRDLLAKRALVIVRHC